MLKEDWEKSLKGLEEILKQRIRDVEELSFTVKCYKKKLKEFG
jgi:hypothetical protein